MSTKITLLSRERYQITESAAVQGYAWFEARLHGERDTELRFAPSLVAPCDRHRILPGAWFVLGETYEDTPTSRKHCWRIRFPWKGDP